jgi:hypothetical protein
VAGDLFYVYNGAGISLNGCGDQGSVYSFEIFGGTGITLTSCYTLENDHISYWVTDSAINVTLIDCQELTPEVGAVHSFQFDAGCVVNVIGWNYTTAPLQTAVPNTLNDGSGNLQVAEACYLNGPVNAYDGPTVYGVAAHDSGTSSAGSAPVLTPTITGTASQLSDTTRDYTCTVTVATAGTAFVVAIGPTSSVTTTIHPSSPAVAGISFTWRQPAGWYVKITGTSLVYSTVCVGC